MQSTISTQLFYWPIRFRGNIIRFILSEAKVEFEDVNAGQRILDFVFGEDSRKSIPTFAPPVLQIDDFTLTQSAAIAQYLARKHGLDGETLEQSAHALMIYCHSNDILNELTRDGGHYDFWDQAKWDTFIATRFNKWMTLLQKLLKGEFFFDKITYADFAVFTVLDGLVHDFKIDLQPQYPELNSFYNRLLARPSVVRVLEPQRAANFLFCGGQIQKSIESVALKQ